MNERAYKVEEVTTSVQALLHDLQVRLLRAAIKGSMSGDSKADFRAKLSWAADKIEHLPED